jgi:hypothetical protein
VAAGFMTLVAAVAAWFAVQKQIAIQQEIARTQTAIQKFSILQSEFVALETERRLILKLKYHAAMAENPHSFLRSKNLNIFGARMILAQYLDCEKGITNFDNELELTTNNRWIFPESNVQKRVVIERKTEFETALGLARIELDFISKAYDAADEDNVLTQQEQVACAAIDLAPSAQALIGACDDCVASIQPAITRVENLIRKARLDAGV